jgi:predicted O-linked N-acetylglucosamine transferase (SPINDLY family)
LPAPAAGFVTFASRNNLIKLSDAALELWLDILEAVPRSRLLLSVLPGSPRDRLRGCLARRNISAERLIFAANQPWAEFVQSYQTVDLALDPFPYCGWITTCDALWLGAPVVTLSGNTALGRGGRSILYNLGLPELVAETPRQYFEIAVSLANDLCRLEELRLSLRGRMERSPLRDPAALARDIEAAYRRMWRKWCSEATMK